MASRNDGDDARGTAAEPVRHRLPSFPVLSNDQVFLRRIVPSDAPSIREISFYDGIGATSDRDAATILERIEQDYRRGETVHWGICLQGSTRIVGTCGFYRGYPGNVGEVGYVLREAYRGRGIMTSAVGLVVAHGLEELKLDGIVAYTDPANVASIAVLERVGFALVKRGREQLTFSLIAATRDRSPTDATKKSAPARGPSVS